MGGGTHNNLSGQGMDPHVDYNYLELSGKKLHRRINAIVYLNEYWEERFGGCLELHHNPFDPDNNVIEQIIPIKNRMVIFETNEYSWHGFKKVDAKYNLNLSRKSFALYLYSVDRPQNEIVPNHGTVYVPEIDVDEPIDLLKLRDQRNHCLKIIKELYNLEKRLNHEINQLSLHLKELNSAVKPNLIGFVTLEDNSLYGYCHDKWIESECGFLVRAFSKINKITLSVYNPDQKTREIEIIVEEKVFKFKVFSGIFLCNIELNFILPDKFKIKIHSDVYLANNLDKRKNISFILNWVKFE